MAQQVEYTKVRSVEKNYHLNCYRENCETFSSRKWVYFQWEKERKLYSHGVCLLPSH